MEPSFPFLTIRQAAQAVLPVPVSPKTIRNAIKAGNLRAHKRTLGKRPIYFINADDLAGTFTMLTH
jgi:hypothetical protein